MCISASRSRCAGNAEQGSSSPSVAMLTAEVAEVELQAANRWR